MATERRRLQSMERICRETRQRLRSRDGDITTNDDDGGGDSDGEADGIELQMTLRRQQEAVDSQRKVLDDLEFQLLEVVIIDIDTVYIYGCNLYNIDGPTVKLMTRCF
jgi:hypothetical protein